jgi:hypothetical protein
MAALAASVFSFALSSFSDLPFSVLPRPIHAPAVSDDDDDIFPQPEPSTSTVVTRTAAPPYGQRNGWKPSAPEDFGQSIWLLFAISELTTVQAMVVHIRNAMLHSIHWIWAVKRYGLPTHHRTPFHILCFVGLIRQHARSSSRQRGKRTLRCHRPPGPTAWQNHPIPIQRPRPAQPPKRS